VLDGPTDAELDGAGAFPPQEDPGCTVARMVAWVNSELMKNVAEIGQLRMVRAAASG
jgi:hypothetical protein